MMRTAIITGASKGIGLEITKKFLKNNYKVITISRSKLNLKKKNHTHFRLDLTNWKEASKKLDLIKSKLKRLDVLINNVGLSKWKPIEEINEIFLEKMFKTNINTYFLTTKIFLSKFKKGSSIINMSSIAGKRGSINNSVYCATKFAINGMTQSWAKELGKRGIKVNAICPVLIKTPGLVTALNDINSPVNGKKINFFLKSFIKNQAALNHLPNPEDVADLCLFLSGRESNSITGQCINLDSGVFPQ